MERTYIAIDLKSFYASVECVERGLDPLDTLLVVADESRTSKTICLAVSPALKAYGTGGRPRLFEVESVVRKVNAGRRGADKSHSARELASNPTLCVDYIVAPPRMAHYIDYSTRIFNVYLRHIAPEDIHVYSIDEVFIDATHYLSTYKLTPRELAMKIILDVLATTGITATAGIGTNLYVAIVIYCTIGIGHNHRNSIVTIEHSEHKAEVGVIVGTIERTHRFCPHLHLAQLLLFKVGNKSI